MADMPRAVQRSGCDTRRTNDASTALRSATDLRRNGAAQTIPRPERERPAMSGIRGTGEPQQVRDPRERQVHRAGLLKVVAASFRLSSEHRKRKWYPDAPASRGEQQHGRRVASTPVPTPPIAIRAPKNRSNGLFLHEWYFPLLAKSASRRVP
jgi:hypothetical protein